MKRRGFLTGLAALFAAPELPPALRDVRDEIGHVLIKEHLQRAYELLTKQCRLTVHKAAVLRVEGYRLHVAEILDTEIR